VGYGQDGGGGWVVGGALEGHSWRFVIFGVFKHCTGIFCGFEVLNVTGLNDCMILRMLRILNESLGR